MGTKTGCCLDREAPIAAFEPVYKIDAQHPSLYTALEDLFIYERWVSHVVLPIAFQWIEEHKKDVYHDIPTEFRDDIGVVIAKAFEMVNKMPCTRNPTLKAVHNPVWARISTKMGDARRAALKVESKLLNETTCVKI